MASPLRTGLAPIGATAVETRWIPTPEGIALPFQVATAGDRMVAFSIDFFLILVVSFGVYIAAFFLVPFGAGAVALALALLVSFLFRNCYFAALELRWAGATVGKRKAGIRVIARDGGPLTTGAVFARNLTRDIEFFLPLTVLSDPRLVVANAPYWGVLLGAGWVLVFALLPLFNKDRLRCGDLIGGTMVVRAPNPVLLPDLAGTSAREPGSGPVPQYLFTSEQLELYGIKELQVLEDLLRRYDDHTVDSVTLELVAGKIRNKIGWSSERRAETVPFLKAFYSAQRARLEQKLLFGKRQEEKKR